MRPALTVEGAVEVAQLERSGLVESRHLGAAAVVDAGGTVVRSLGDSAALVYPRSSLKLLQASAVLSTGVNLTPEQAALAAASHAGTPRHVEVVRSILLDAGLDESSLQCPADFPVDPHAQFAIVSAGGGRMPITMNCSGKHASFLLACVTNGWPIESYLAPTNPLQMVIRAHVERLAGEAVEHTGIDGCGAPVHALTLAGLARAVSRIAGPSADANGHYLASSIRANGWAIDGPGRANATTIDTLGLVAKMGAEGVMVMGAADGTAVAVKILDGSLRAATLVALELLVQAGTIPRAGADAVLASTLERVLGSGQPVGAITAAF